MLCLLAHQFPPFVADFLGRGRSLRRRFREESVTDLLMGSLVAVGGSRVIVEFPDEFVTGADMEWNFVNSDDNTFFRILLQAKQAYGDGKIWTRHTYRELLHVSGGKFQAEILCDTARAESATYPLYILYHPVQTCSSACMAGSAHVVGVNLADGYRIERLVKTATTRALRTRNKSLGTIAPHLFLLSDLFCPSTLLQMGPFGLAAGFPRMVYIMTSGRQRGLAGFPIPPTPQQVRDRLSEVRRGSIKTAAEDSEQISSMPEVPAIATAIPEDVRAVLRGSEEIKEEAVQRKPLRRWRITFVSASPREIDRG